MKNEYNRQTALSGKDIDVIPYSKDASILRNDACTEGSAVVRQIIIIFSSKFVFIKLFLYSKLLPIQQFVRLF